jgi:hypothetical protein
MSNNHVITRDIGNLRGISTDSIFLRPSNVAEKATNLQKSPDGTIQIRRGYQAQTSGIGGMGIGTFDDPATDEIRTIAVGVDGQVYNKQTKQFILYYNAIVSGVITDASNSNPVEMESVAHGLLPGAVVTIRGILVSGGGTYPLNNLQYVVHSVPDADHFTLYNLDGTPVDTSNTVDYPPYVSGGSWTISFTENRYLTFSIYVDPALIYNGSGQSINSRILANRAAQIDGSQTLTNVFTVFFGHNVRVGSIVQFYNIRGVLQQRNVTAISDYTITVDGAPASVLGNSFFSMYFDFPFGKGFDISSPYLISQFITAITDPSTGVPGLTISINGNTNIPAAFLQIVEATIIDQNNPFIMDYWYWTQINFTFNPPLPGSANTQYQNSKEFENASMAAFDDVIYICNGWDFPQKFDGQTIYRAGMPIGVRPAAVDQVAALSMPFLTGQTYEYAMTYEQVDARGHIVEGEISAVRQHTIGTTPSAIDVTVTNLISTRGNNWNTDGALAIAGTATVYGPDAPIPPDTTGFYYDFVSLTPGFTLKIGDTAYYADQTAAVMTAASTSNTIPVLAGHAIIPGDTVYFYDTGDSRTVQRVVELTTATSITVLGAPVTFDFASNPNIMAYKTSLVFGNVAIVSGTANTNVNNILVTVGHTVQLNDVVEFVDAQNNLQRRTVTFVDATHVTVSGRPVSVIQGSLIASTNQGTNGLNFRRSNANGITFIAHNALTAPYGTLAISNNLRINIYRTLADESFGVNGELFLVAAIPNDSIGSNLQIYTDGLIGVSGTPNTEELGRQFDDPDQAPNPPPISKYVKAFGNQIFYAGGERGKPENSDRVFFSDGNAPEVVPLASNFFNVPNVDDDVTGIGVSGSTFITTKNHSLWAATGNFLTGQIDVVQIAPGTNIGCVAHATICSVGTLMYFVHTNGVYAITENQLFPTDSFGNPIPISLAIDSIFRESNYLPQNKYVFKRAVAVNYTKDNQYILFLPCEDTQTTIRDANANSLVLAYDYQGKNWFPWNNINAAGGIFVVDDDLYFQERRFSRVDGNSFNLYKQHRFYRLVDHADHAGAQYCEWLSSWEDLGQPEVRKKFCRCVLLMDRLSELLQFNNPEMEFASYLNRLPNLKNTIAVVTQVDNVRNSAWSESGWGWNYWSGYQDSFITVNLKRGTVAKSMQVGFTIKGINMDIRLAGFQLEAIPENRKSVLR